MRRSYQYHCPLCGISSNNPIICTPEANCLNIPLAAELELLKEESEYYKKRHQKIIEDHKKVSKK